MSIPEKTAARVLVKSARHCCICRRFSPLQIQVHHIVEVSDGGTDDEANLIPICIGCHSVVHTSPHMTRAFTREELRGHRDEVYDMVAKGKLPVQSQITTGEMHVLAATILQTLKAEGKETYLSDDATELLLATACEETPIIIDKTNKHVHLTVGGQNFLHPPEQGTLPAALLELAQRGFLELHEDTATLTANGMAHVERLVGTTAKYVQKKVKCMKCSLHFTIHSWRPDAHRASELHCPECGQSEGFFLVWAQNRFGFIFEEVPGRAVPWDFGGLPRTS